MKMIICKNIRETDRQTDGTNDRFRSRPFSPIPLKEYIVGKHKFVVNSKGSANSQDWHYYQKHHHHYQCLETSTISLWFSSWSWFWSSPWLVALSKAHSLRNFRRHGCVIIRKMLSSVSYQNCSPIYVTSSPITRQDPTPSTSHLYHRRATQMAPVRTVL